jgi:hypothetical protein
MTKRLLVVPGELPPPCCRSCGKVLTDGARTCALGVGEMQQRTSRTKAAKFVCCSELCLSHVLLCMVALELKGTSHAPPENSDDESASLPFPAPEPDA